MARNPPLPDPDGSEQTPYQYESEGEEKLGESARALVRETGGNYRWARTALLAYTRPDIKYLPASPSTDVSTSPEQPVTRTPARQPSFPPAPPPPDLPASPEQPVTRTPARQHSFPPAPPPPDLPASPEQPVTRTPARQSSLHLVSPSTNATTSLKRHITHTLAQQSSSLAQSLPSTNKPKDVAPITPPPTQLTRTVPTTPPTSSASRRHGTARTSPVVARPTPTIVRTTPSIVQTSPGALTSRLGTRSAGLPPRNNITDNQPQLPDPEQLDHAPPQPPNRSFTVLFPLLAETGMEGYFRIEDSISHRSRQVVRAMLTRIKQDPEWLGDASYVNMIDCDPVDDEWCIHQPPPGVVSPAWYAICAGTHIGIFASEHDVHEYTEGIANSIHYKARNRMQACRSFQLALIIGVVRLLPLRRPE